MTTIQLLMARAAELAKISQKNCQDSADYYVPLISGNKQRNAESLQCMYLFHTIQSESQQPKLG